jgi:hypothetical protein
MGFKLAMPSMSFSKSEPSALALTHARLKAWWNGEERVDPKVVLGRSDTSGAVGEAEPAQIEWPLVHAQASAAIWGSGRTYPCTLQLENQLLNEGNATKASRIAIFAGGAGAMARAASQSTAAKIEVFEHNPALLKLSEDLLKTTKQAKRFGYHSFDWMPGKLPKGKADAAIFMFQGGVDGRLEAASFCAERILRAGGYCVWFDMFARKDDATLDACRGADMRTFSNEDEAIIAFSASGLTVVGDDDWSARYLDAYDVAWRDLSINLGLRQASLIKSGGINAGNSALENLISWKARQEAIRTGKITVRRYLLQA